MEKNNINESLRESYSTLTPFSQKYRGDFKRFLFSLNLLFPLGIKGKKILDIGSGIGIMAIALKNLGAEVTGVDKFIFPDERENFYSIFDFEKMKSIWEENSFKVVKSDIAYEKLPFSDGDFDIVICDATIEHFDNSPKDLFKEVHRVLKNKGLFLVTTPNLASLLKRLRFFIFGRSPNWDLKDFFESGPNFKGHRREFTLLEMVKMLKWSSFGVLDKKTKNIFFNPKKFFLSRKIAEQFCCLLSQPFPAMREMIYILAKKL